MKQLFTTSFFLLSLLYTPLMAQLETLVLKPGAEGEDTWLNDRDGQRDNNCANGKELVLYNWTFDGRPYRVQLAMRFDLTQLPPDAIIEDAHLSLFNSPNSNEGHQRGHEGRNTDFAIRRITTPWEENTVTFNTTPKSTRTGEVLVAGHRTNNQDFTDLKVTELVQTMHTGENFGFYLSLTGRDIYNTLIFASSDHSNADLHPELKINYSVPEEGGRSIGVQFLTSSPANSHHVVDLTGIPAGELKYNVVNLHGNRFVPPTVLPGRAKTELTLSSLPRGTYLLTLTLNGQHYATNKFVIRKQVVLP